MITPSGFYAERLQQLSSEKKRIEQKLFYIYLLRLVAFALFIVLLVQAIQQKGEFWYVAASTGMLAIFFAVVRWHSIITERKVWIEKKIAVNENEQKFLEFDYEKFSNGEQYKYIDPNLTADFDIFGNSSLFQYINRGSTPEGSRQLAKNLCSWSTDSQTITNKQEAILELSGKTMFLENFQASKLSPDHKAADLNNLLEWFNSPIIVTTKVRLLISIYTITFAATLIMVILSVFPTISLGFLLIFALLIVFGFKKNVDNAHAKLGHSTKLYQTYSKIISDIENEPFKSAYLTNIQDSFKSDGLKASTSISKLFKLLNRFDYRFNFVINILFNSTFLFDLQILSQLEQWKAKHKPFASSWFDSVSQFDSLQSFARFAFNNSSSTVFPSVSANDPSIKGENVGHPLIPINKRVNNNIDFYGQPKLIVITGANMAGKSTFLRTLAINLILAHNGSPVCASSFEFFPCNIASSINIHDSLANNESYFYAELKRINRIIEQVSENPKTLVFLDEILRGTNPNDKQLGSIGLAKKLIKLNTFTIIATHDLAIGDLEKEYPNIVINKCFEVEIEDDKLIFDYKLKDGVSKKLNASFLMRKMNIID